jgi:hypothetical protein
VEVKRSSTDYHNDLDDRVGLKNHSQNQVTNRRWRSLFGELRRRSANDAAMSFENTNNSAAPSRGCLFDQKAMRTKISHCS